MKEYYIVSLKWTFPHSYAFTLWGENNNGYCWYKEWAGVYEIKEDSNYYDNKYDTQAIPKQIADKLFVSAIHEDRVVMLLLNDVKNRKLLGIKKRTLQGGMSNITKEQVTLLKELHPVGSR